ncbi:MAG: LuxR C-terminal-related transcriptional regulator [Minisyncoccia bacterium]
MEKINILFLNAFIVSRTDTISFLEKDNCRVTISSEQKFLNFCSTKKFNVAIIEVTTFDILNKMYLIKQAINIWPEIKIIILSTLEPEKEEIIESALKAIRKITSREESLKNLSQTISVFIKNNYNLLERSTEIINIKISYFNKINLTEKEKEILFLLCNGLTTKEVANKLFISKRTVDGHKRNLFKKTMSKSIIQLAMFAFKNKLI